MKRLLPLLCLLLLSGCGTRQPTSDGAPVPDPNLGTYHCISAVMDGMELGAQGQWIRLEENGAATFFLIHEPDEGSWSLIGPTFTMTIGNEVLAAGTLENGILTVDFMEMDCVFVREGVTPPREPAVAQPQTDIPTAPEEPQNTPPVGMAFFSCYGGLYQITYPTALFYPPGDGLTDLISDTTGTKVWITRLDSKEAVETWLAVPQGEQQEQLSLTVANYPAQALIYAADGVWHSEIIVDFGKNLGTDLHPMYAACLTFSGPDREAVWGKAIQDIVHSLTLL